MMFKDLILKNRSFRRFHEDSLISLDILKELVDLARLSASASNLQPLRYVLSCDPATNDLVFPLLAWAGYIEDWVGPTKGERPSAYIIILGDTTVIQDVNCDHGIAAQSILLGATEKGLGGCMIASIQRDKLRAVLHIPDRYRILLVLALGQPKEDVVLDTADADGDIKYWRDADGVHHVPKRRLADIIVG